MVVVILILAMGSQKLLLVGKIYRLNRKLFSKKPLVGHLTW